MATVKEISLALTATFKTRDDLEQLVIFASGLTLDQVTSPASLPIEIQRVVVAARTNSWLLQLLDEASQMRPDDQALKDLLKAAAPISANPANPWQALVINGQPLVDRDAIRTSVRQLDANQARILVVFGDEATGKSHLSNLITWRATEAAARMVTVNLEQLWKLASAENRRLAPRDIAMRFCDQLGFGYEIIPSNDEQDSRWAIIFCDRVQARLDAGQVYWFVVDEFNKIATSQQIVDLVKEFASRVSTTMANVRLVLLGFGDTLPTSVEPGVLRQRVPHLAESDIKEYFANLYASVGRGHDAPAIAGSVAKVLPLLHPSDAVTIRGLGVTLAQEARAVI